MNPVKLPLRCDVTYIEDFLTEEEAWELYELLLNTYAIDNARLIINAGGKLIETDSFKILFTTQKLIDQESHPEHIHGKNHVWSGALLALKNKVEQHTGKTFDLAMALYYPNGNYFAAYHNDQRTSGAETLLPSLSLGEVRPFSFKENTTEDAYSLDLANGSLLIMGKGCQENYMHSLPKSSQHTRPRINITFREPNFQ